jgi:hypothetical protein
MSGNMRLSLLILHGLADERKRSLNVEMLRAR